MNYKFFWLVYIFSWKLTIMFGIVASAMLINGIYSSNVVFIGFGVFFGVISIAFYLANDRAFDILEWYWTKFDPYIYKKYHFIKLFLRRL